MLSYLNNKKGNLQSSYKIEIKINLEYLISSFGICLTLMFFDVDDGFLDNQGSVGSSSNSSHTALIVSAVVAFDVVFVAFSESVTSFKKPSGAELACGCELVDTVGCDRYLAHRFLL